jgi:hypothetical protein
VLGLNSAEAAGFVKSPQPLVAKRLNHGSSIARCAPRNKSGLTLATSAERCIA